MTDEKTIRTSKFLSLILRHEPGKIVLKLGDASWVVVDELLRAVNANGCSAHGVWPVDHVPPQFIAFPTA